jgi:hypothetical protein
MKAVQRGQTAGDPIHGRSSRAQRYNHDWMLRRVLLVIALGAAMLGCSETPTSPSPERYRIPRLQAACVPAAILVRCTATLYDVPRWGDSADVTSQSIWLLSDPTLGTIDRGIFTPTRRGEVSITARYQQWEDPLASSFLVDPDQPAQRLNWVSGIVRDDASSSPIQGARVEIVRGYNEGASAITNQFGHYRIEPILTAVSFSISASKDGYLPSTTVYRVDSPIGPPGNPPFLDFRLTQAP